MTIDTCKTIFVVDDEAMITGPLERLIEDMLEENELDEQYEIVTKNNPRDALDEIKRDRANVALVVSDIMMPEMNGLDFLKQVKELCSMPPRIVLTGFADKENAITALNELGLFYYVEKPWDDDWLATLLLNALIQYRQTRKETMFDRYVPHEVIEEFINQDDDAILKGQILDVTILFMDIVDFTRRTEKLDAPAIVDLLNDCFAAMVEVVHKQVGILDKYMGDGLMALFGAPRSVGTPAKDAANAVLAALQMVDRIVKLNAERKKAGGEPVRIRIGLDSGKVVAGNIGSTRRVNYTVIGDAANTASRIEDAARHAIKEEEMGCVLISHNTYQYVHSVLPDIDFLPLGPMRLRGKEEKVPLYKVTR